jgi:hypothetical protein
MNETQTVCPDQQLLRQKCQSTSDCNLLAVETTRTGPSDSMVSISTLGYDLEKTAAGVASTSMNTETLDIEHVPVQNDPRKWSPLRKVSCPTTTKVSSVLTHRLFLYLECYSGIDLFCIYNRWNCSQYTKP